MLQTLISYSTNMGGAATIAAQDENKALLLSTLALKFVLSEYLTRVSAWDESQFAVGERVLMRK